MKGIRAEIMKNPLYAGCSNGGVSSRCNTVTIVGQGIAEIFEADADAPAVYLVPGNTPGTVKAVPADLHDQGKWLMSGGSFLCLGDSRLCRVADKICGGIFYGAVAFHDRHEG